MSKRNHLLTLAFLLAAASSAQAAPTRAKVVTFAPAKTAKANHGKLANVSRFIHNNVNTNLKTTLRNKTLLVVPKKEVREYSLRMKNSVEIMFQPKASPEGHLLVRVGERFYDFPSPSGVRAQNFANAMRYVNSHAYGFVFMRTTHEIGQLQQAFEAFANDRSKSFSMFGVGPTKFSCAGFVTSMLREHAPELKISLSAGAVSAAQHLLSSGTHDAVTLYGAAANDAKQGQFAFLRLH